MFQDRVLLVSLGAEEREHISHLLASFDIEVMTIDVRDPEKALSLNDPEPICLVVYQIDPKRERPDQDILRIRRRFPQPIPFLLLVPPPSAPAIRNLIKAGADDYWVLPLDETAFPVRFYVLLECGQAVAHIPPDPRFPTDTGAGTEPGLWRRLIDRFKDGLNFFSSSQLIQGDTQCLIMNRWSRVRFLGHGGSGGVWLIRDREKGHLAVAKIPHSPNLNLQALRCAAILKRLSRHPNIAQLIEVVRDNGRIILIQEYVPGQTLQQRLSGGISAREREAIYLSLLAVVGFAHQHKIMHRDIKPENIIITDAGTLKLLDFGIAKDMSRRRITDTVVGSYPFMAPEQILGGGGIPMDVWALGVTLYILATDSLPFFHENEKYLIDAILETIPLRPKELAPGLPDGLEAIILKCLEKKPENRYADARELRSALLQAFPNFGNGDVLPSGLKA